MLKKRAMREFEKMGLDPDAVVKRGKFTEDELNLIRRTFAGETQFNIRPSDLPLWWSSPLGRVITQWKPFSYKMTQLIRDNVVAELRRGNPMPLITMVTAYGVGGEAVNTLIDLVRGVLNFNPRKEQEEKGVFGRTAYQKLKEGDVEGLVYRMIDNYSGLGAMGFMADIFRSMGYGKAGDTLSGVTSAVLGPTVSTLLSATSEVTGPIMQKLWNQEGEWDEAMLRSLRGAYRQVLTNVPFGSIPRTFGFTKWLEKQIFGENKSDKQKVYDELQKQGVDVSKLEAIDEKVKKVKELYDKAKESREKADIDAYVKADEELDKLQESTPEFEKYAEFKRKQGQESDELFSRGRFKIYNELKQKGLDIEKLKALDEKEREVMKLKEKAERTRNKDDMRAWKLAENNLKKERNKSREYNEYLKLKNRQSVDKKKEREELFK
jgi:predicted metal-dependent HD superfamily phosphohydrolase